MEKNTKMTDVMHNRKRMMKRVFYGMGVLLLLLVCVALLLPRFINTALVKEKLLHGLSQKVSGTVTFRNIAISLFPVPRLVIDQVRIAMPERLDATVATLWDLSRDHPALQRRSEDIQTPGAGPCDCAPCL